MNLTKFTPKLDKVCKINTHVTHWPFAAFTQAEQYMVEVVTP